MIVLDSNGKTDGVAYNFLQRVKSDVPIVLVSRVEDLVLNEQVYDLKGKEWVLIDFVELGWDWNRKFGHIWGENTEWFPEVFRSDDWKRFDDFVLYNPPSIIFQRELLKKDEGEQLVPIQYPCFLNPVAVQSEQEFNNRHLEVFNTWGLSNEYRKELHGNIWIKAGKYGYSVCDNIFYLKDFLENENNRCKWFTANIPHYCRIPMEELIMLNGIAKLSFSMPGAGVDCFRHAESPVNSVMLMQNDTLAWSIDWIDNVNCIKADKGKEIERAIEALGDSRLYDIYLKGVETCDKYRIDNYIKNYIEPLINKEW